MGEAFDAYFQRKVVALAGDINKDYMGLSEADRARVCASVHLLIHCAANVDFNERLDGAIRTNCRGPLRMLKLAELCPRLLSYVHVSTAYVNCNQPSGARVKEELPVLAADGEAIMHEFDALDPAAIPARSAALLRESKYPNTYTFTKAMGEHLLAKHHGAVPVAVVRPTIIGAAWQEPEPGWVDTVSAGGALFLTGGLGFMPVQPGNPDLIGDQIPVDLVVNCILIAAAEAAARGAGFFNIFHSSSSTTNPVKWSTCADAVSHYWRARPSAKSQLTCQYTMVHNPIVYQWQYLTKVHIPALALSAYSTVSRSASIKRKSADFAKVIRRCRVLAQTFFHFVNNEWFYDAANALAAHAALTERDRGRFPVDPSGVVWPQYFDDFSYGLQRFVLRDDVVRKRSLTDAIARAKGKGVWLLPDLAFALRYRLQHAQHYRVPAADAVAREVLAAREVRDAMGKQTDGEARARAMLEEMAANMSLPTVRFVGWLLSKVNRRLFSAVFVDEASVEALRALPANEPVVLLPTHRSYLDFLLVSWVLFTFDLKLPHIAAGSDFLNVALVASLFRRSGAFFIPRTLVNDPLWAAVLSAYAQVLLRNNQWVEFFVEGKRSRSGRLLPPKRGLLSMCAEAFFSGHVGDMHYIPVAISYDRPPDLEAHVRELRGIPKTKESFKALMSAAPRKLAQSHGRVEVTLGAPISLATCVRLAGSGAGGGAGGTVAGRKRGDAWLNTMVEAVETQYLRHLAVPPGALAAAILLRHHQRGVQGVRAGGGGPGVLAMSTLKVEMGRLRRRVVDRGTNILDGRVIAQDLEQALQSCADAIRVVVCVLVCSGKGRDGGLCMCGLVGGSVCAYARGATRTHTHTHTHTQGRGKEATVSIDSSCNVGAVTSLSYLQNAALHVFALDAVVLFALVTACKGWGARVAAVAERAVPGANSGAAASKKVIEAEGVEIPLEAEGGVDASGGPGGEGDSRIGTLRASMSRLVEAWSAVYSLVRYEVVFAGTTGGQEGVEAVLQGLCKERVLAGLGGGREREYAVRGDAAARAHWNVVATMFLPIVEAYWAVAVQAVASLAEADKSSVPDDAGAGEKRSVGVSKAVLARLHGNVVTLCARGFVVFEEAASTEMVISAR